MTDPRAIYLPLRVANRLKRLRKLAGWTQSELETWIADELDGAARDAAAHTDGGVDEDH
jgi:hypothetical protein